MISRFKYATVFLIFFIFLGNHYTFGQCPDGVDISTNAHCLFVNWMTVPDPLPMEVIHEGETYIYQSGTGTVTDPAVYQNGGGGGACNATPNPFTGTIIVDGMECTYVDGILEPPLPIDLLKFKATLLNREVMLEWTTAQELVNSGFDVQKSSDGATWSHLIWIDGSGNSSVLKDYFALDNNPHSGNNYYRLRQIDQDGSIEFSHIESVNVNSLAEQFKIYPNPASGTLYIEGNRENAITVMNMSGMVLFNDRIENDYTIDISTLPQGIYFVQNSSTGEVLKFSKL